MNNTIQSSRYSKQEYEKYIFILAAALTAGANLLHAQSTEHKGLLWSSLHGLDYEFKAGVNIGGTSPLPLPKEIRSLDSYSPGLAITIEGNATKWVDAAQKWGISLGVRLDSKDMTTRATVKNYGMAIFNEVGGKVEGLWTGGVKTKVKMSYITIPLLANYKINNRWKVVAGPYFSYMMDGDFQEKFMKDICALPMLREAALILKVTTQLHMTFLMNYVVSNGVFRLEEAGKLTNTSLYTLI